MAKANQSEKSSLTKLLWSKQQEGISCRNSEVVGQ